MSQAAEQAELAYQRALAALHEARADLAAVQASIRRLVYDRSGLPAAVAELREAELGARRELLEAQVASLRVEAERRRHAREVPAGAEPALPAPDPGGEGFEQPPFARDDR